MSTSSHEITTADARTLLLSTLAALFAESGVSRSSLRDAAAALIEAYGWMPTHETDALVFEAAAVLSLLSCYASDVVTVQVAA